MDRTSSAFLSMNSSEDDEDELKAVEQNYKELQKGEEIEGAVKVDNAGAADGTNAQGQQIIDEIERQLCIPQQAEMHTFRDAINVNYQRMCLTDEGLSEIPLANLRLANEYLKNERGAQLHSSSSCSLPPSIEEAERTRMVWASAAHYLTGALHKRSEYMDLLGAKFPTTTQNFLTGKYPGDLAKSRHKNIGLSTKVDYNPPEPPKDHWGLDEPLPVYANKFTLKRMHGTIAILESEGSEIVGELHKYYVNKDKYLDDLNWINGICNDGPLKTFCFRQLDFLKNRFVEHVLLNGNLESAEQMSIKHRDFYNIRKVDTYIHATAAMNQPHLLQFVKKKMQTDADEVVQVKDGKEVTMKEMFAQMGISRDNLTVDMLNVHADMNIFHHFDKYNAHYNPNDKEVLRKLFMKTDNHVGGKYFAQLMKEVLSDVEESKYQHMEPRMSIYGKAKDEWDKLAKWAIGHDVWSKNSRWMIQIPRRYDEYRRGNLIANFDVFLDNIFAPLFEVTNDPGTHPELHRFLQHISGFDSVDDESKHENVPFTVDCPEPADYSGTENPSYSYYLFYMYSNLAALNAFRRMRGLNTFTLRPICGEAGHTNHLAVAFLMAESISSGLLLRKAMSPLANNHLHLAYSRNPMPEYLMRGLNVSLSTAAPMKFHFTKEPLMEEYNIAAQLWKWSPCDMCELARNSVLQSGFEHCVKIHWLGPNYKEEGVFGNDITRTNVPDVRVSFRHELLVNELMNLFKFKTDKTNDLEV